MPDEVTATETDHRMMELALKQAATAAELGEVPVGAVVYRGDQILAQAHNLRETAADPTAHAEIIALRTAAGVLGTWRLEECSLAVTLEPCPMCAGAIVNSRIAKVVYGATDPKMGAVDTLYHLCGDSRLNHRVPVVSGVMSQACGELLSDFFKARRRGDAPPKPSPGTSS